MFTFEKDRELHKNFLCNSLSFSKVTFFSLFIKKWEKSEQITWRVNYEESKYWREQSIWRVNIEESKLCVAMLTWSRILHSNCFDEHH